MTFTDPVTPAQESGRGHPAAVVYSGLGRSLEEFAPVLAVTLLTPGDPMRAEIFVGVRTAAANKTHPDVASVPTRRVPRLLARSWLEQLRLGQHEEAGRRDDLRAEVANIFSRKLGLADALELETFRFRVERLDAVQGHSVIGELDDGSPVAEQLTMFNAHVVVEEGRAGMAKATASYDPLLWGDVPGFLEMTRHADAGRFAPELADTFVCAYGLCLRTSVRMIESLVRGG
jgi:hypothetical protein